MRNFNLLKSFMLICMLTVFGVNSAWAQEMTISSVFKSADVISNNSSYKSYSTADWYLSWGGGGTNNTVGFNKVGQRKALTADDVLGTGATANNVGAVIKSFKKIQSVNNVTFTYSNSAGNGGKIYLASSEDGTTWTPVVTEGLEITNGQKFTFETITSAYYKIVLEGKSSSETQFRYDKVEITFYSVETSGKTPAGIAYATTEYTVNLGETFETPTLTNPNGLTATYESSNPEVARVDYTTGAVTIVGEGTTTITATTEENETYAKGTATYTLTVIDPTNVFTLVTDASKLRAGDKIIITNGTNGNVMAMKPYESGNNCKATSITITDGKISYPGEAAIITLGGEKDKWTFFDGANYLYAAASNLDDNYMKGTSELGSGNEYKATIAINESATNAVITFNVTDRRHILQYNKTSPIFSCYAGAQNNVYIFCKPAPVITGTFTIGEDGYATYYTDKAYVMPEGAEGAIITGVQGDKLTIDYKYTAGTTVPAKSALLLKGKKGEEKTYTYEVVTSDETPAEGNMLHGAEDVKDGKTYVEGGSVKYYILTHNAEKTDFGFYWAAADGAATEYVAPYAFLAVDATKMSAPKMFSLDGDGNTSGITNIESTAKADGRIFTVTGAYAGNDINRLPKGVYIMNGKKVVVRK